LVLVFLSATILVALGMEPLSSFSGVIATTGNVGPGLGSVGPMSNYSLVPSTGKWVLTVTMLLGRLEIYGLLLFFTPAIWKMRSRI
ncbi:MAG: TrkH family potassium uptake protein, partial [Calditrichaeota bacterium]|nr:TrkH family potassium uptake protein [Calditrichota bacterium]